MTTEPRDPFALARQGEHDPDAELFALIAEFWRRRKEEDAISAEAQRRENDLPPAPPISVEIGRLVWADGTEKICYADREEELTDDMAMTVAVVGQLPEGRRNEAPKDCETYFGRREELLAEFRVKQTFVIEARNKLCEAAGIDELWDRWTKMREETEVLDERIDAIRPATLAGVVALIDFYEERDIDHVPEQAIAGIREIARAAARFVPEIEEGRP